MMLTPEIVGTPSARPNGVGTACRDPVPRAGRAASHRTAVRNPAAAPGRAEAKADLLTFAWQYAVIIAGVGTTHRATASQDHPIANGLSQ